MLLARLLGYSRRAGQAAAEELLAAFEPRRRRRARAPGPIAAACAAGSTSRPASSCTPDLLFLDEPTTGLDPRSRNRSGRSSATVVGQGTTVLLTTQYLDEADQLADRIAVIDHGA